MYRNVSKLGPTAKKRKLDIVEISLELFAENGYRATSLEDVANRVGVSKAALYYYFSNKDEILRAVLERTVSRMDKILDIDDSTLPAHDKLRQFIRQHVKIGHEGMHLAKIYFDQADVIPSRMRNALRKKEKKIFALLRDILNQGIDEGNFSIDDVKTTSLAILGMCNWTYRWYSSDKRLSSKHLTEKYLNLVEKGLLKDPLIS
jgi:TetR/AcrR family transcriptional regulator, cholesterol catabolism regulator